jgi:hypothetical protein
MKKLGFALLMTAFYVFLWKVVSFEFAVIVGIITIISDTTFNTEEK